MAERQPIPIPEPKHAPPESSRGIPPTIHERANPPPESSALPTLPQKSVLYKSSPYAPRYPTRLVEVGALDSLAGG